MLTLTAVSIVTIQDRLEVQEELEAILDEDPSPIPGSPTELRVRELSLALQDYAARKLLGPCRLAEEGEWF